MKPGTILGHEGVGVVEELGTRRAQLPAWATAWSSPRPSRAATAPTAAPGYFSQCDNANPNGPQAGTAFFGGPASSGPFNGLQAERARIPFANVGMVKLPDDVDRRPGHPALRHLPHRLLRRRPGRDRARRHRGGLRLRPRRPVRHRELHPEAARPRHRRR